MLMKLTPDYFLTKKQLKYVGEIDKLHNFFTYHRDPNVSEADQDQWDKVLYEAKSKHVPEKNNTRIS